MMKRFTLDEIKIKRKKFGLTQLELARKAGVSQSIIAKIEKGRIDPTYSSVVKIIECLDRLESKSTKKVEDLMIKKIISAKPTDKIHDIVLLMKKYEISQLPIIKDSKVVGSISEKTIMDALINNNTDVVKNSKVEEYMGDIPPSVPYGTDIMSVISLLDNFSYVIIIKKGEIIGLLTKSDIIRDFC
ncbi:MAG: CBS domain-containing protein [Nanoarchaeota archaeon]|nr:CBS domain-containing protein [Nanoarchaeota archaeon]